MLKPILEKDLAKGLSIKGSSLIPEKIGAKKQILLLEGYMVNNSVQETISHNLRWANGLEEKPKFKFVYIMLPTSCNQKCVGCFAGRDKRKLPSELNGEMYPAETIEEIINFLKEHEIKTVVYGGGGELFTWKKAFDYIDQVTNSGLKMVIFSNGSLLSKKDIEKLSQKKVSLIISLKDTTEEGHNNLVGVNGFRETLQTIDYAMQLGMHKKNRLAVEIPVTKNNEKRVLHDFIPAMRHLGIIPFPEEFIQIMTSADEKRLCHNFAEARTFFEKASEIDKKFGYFHNPIFGQRMLAQSKCERPLYSFTIYPSGSVMDCPCHSINYGNFYKTSLKEVIYSEKFRSELKKFQLCPCSVFYTKEDTDIPKNLPKHLEAFKCQK